MAVKMIATAQRWVGDTGDTKPTPAPVGSTYLDRQTGALYVCYDGVSWAEWDKLVKLVAGDANIGNVDIVTLPAGNLGQQAMAASLSVVPASNVADQTYLGDIKFGEALPAGSAVIGQVSVDQTTPGTTNLVESRPYARRNAGTLHRDAITAVDKLSAPANPTCVDRSADGGSLTANTTYKISIAAYNRWGTTITNAAIQSVTTANDGNNAHVIRATFAAVTGADGYSIFLSTDANPKWVARVTEAQRASGIIVDAVGSTTAGGAAGAVDVRVVGTGLANNVSPFAVNNAYTPASVTAVNCAGRSRALVKVKLAVTDLRSLPTLRLIPFFANQVSANDWHAGQIQTVPLLTAVGQPQEQVFSLDVDGSTGLAVLVDTISGQGAACSVWVELA